MIAFTINIQKVNAPPMFCNKMGVSWVIKTTPVQRTTVQNDMATPRILVGNISEMITQGIGPKEVAKQAMKPRIKIKSQGPSEKLKWKQMPTAKRQITIPLTPQRSSVLLPALSINHKATKVNTVFTKPINMVCVNAESVANPTLLNISGA